MVMSTASQLEQYRQQFPALANKAYFNFGGQGTLAQPALTAIFETHRQIQEKGPFSLGVHDLLDQIGAETKQLLGKELGAPPQTITLTENVTVGCNIALWGINWRAGDQILMTDCEHPGIVATVREICRRFQVEVSICPLMETLNHGDPVAVIAQYLQPQTRLLILSHLLWNTGQVLPLAAITQLCHQHQPQAVQVLVDAAQSVGSLPLNLTELEADFYAFTGHKWLCGPAGVGGLYVRPEAFYRLNPTFIGWRGIVKDLRGNPLGWTDDGSRFEVATSAYPEYAGLREAIFIHQKWGNAQERYQQICQLSAFLWEGLGQISGIKCLKSSPPEAGLVSFELASNHSPNKLVQSLEEQGFLLRTIADPHCIRACVHYFTTKKEIEHLLEAIENLIT